MTRPVSRTAHKLALLADRDVWHTLAVAAAACAFSFGLVYLGYFVHVLRVARNAPCHAEVGRCLLVFGKHAPGGQIDGDFALRLDRTLSVTRDHSPSRIVLLGGASAGQRSEAELARDALLARGWTTQVPLDLEARSRDTMQNLRNARSLLGAEPAAQPVTLLSSRYHLARCALFARQLGFHGDVCAAEPRLSLGPRSLARLAGEAAYVCWSDVGTRWARLIGHRRMLDRVT